MRPAPSRFPLLRPPPLRLVVAVVLALAVGVAVHRTTASAEAVTADLGSTAVVAVVDRPLAPGDEITPGDVVMQARPVGHLPAGAVVDDPTGRTVRAGVVAGEVLVADRLAGAGRDGAGALVPPGWRGVAIPIVDAAIPARPGDVVDVVASFDPSLDLREPSTVVVPGAVVVDVADDALTVAVPRSRVTAVAFAVANGIVSLALVG